MTPNSQRKIWRWLRFIHVSEIENQNIIQTAKDPLIRPSGALLLKPLQSAINGEADNENERIKYGIFSRAYK
jgi:hypothetical protein